MPGWPGGKQRSMVTSPEQGQEKLYCSYASAGLTGSCCHLRLSQGFGVKNRLERAHWLTFPLLAKTVPTVCICLAFVNACV